MPHREIPVRPIEMRRAFDRALAGGVSLLALMMISDLGEARSLTPGSNTVVPTAAAQQAAIQAAQQAASAAAQAQASLARAAAALAAARKLQSDAAAAAQAAASPVPNGLTAGGLMPAGGTGSDPLAGIKADPSKWRGAELPKQTANGSNVTVDINQTQQKGLFYWDTFNVGTNTTVNFNQSASDWIALNRVLDPAAAPSRIAGQINAKGAVYLINRNGIVFGAGAQVNVHTLVASSLDIGQLGTDLTARDQYYLNAGIANLNSFSIYDAVGGARTTLVAGDVKVERGASISANIATDQVALGSPGSVYLFGANVYNSGSITVPTGEVAMVAARAVDLIPNGYSMLPAAVLGADSSGNALKFRGTEFRISQFDTGYDSDGFGKTNRYLRGTGVVTHDGLIDASRGIVVMNGDTVTTDNPKDASGGAVKDAAGRLVQGVISVDTSIDRNSMVLLRAATSVTMNGVISSLPFDDGAAPLPKAASSGGTVQSFTPAYIEMTAQTNVTVGSSGLVSAPSAQVSLRAIDLSKQNGSGVYQETGRSTTNVSLFGRRLFNQGGNTTTGEGGNPDVIPNATSPQTVLLGPGAVIDVAGLQNVELPAGYNFISFQPRAEFADMPLQRAGPLYGQTLWIDIRASGTRSDGTSWVGTPLADASGYVNTVGRSIQQLMTAGGGVSLQTDLSINNGAGSVQTAGSVINVAGGSVQFLPGMVNATRLIGSDGRIYSTANADPNMTYLGVAGQFTVKHSRWGVTETWSTATQLYSPGYTEGVDAGTVSVVTVTPSLLGTIYFGATAGERQIAAGQLPLQGSLALMTPSSVQIGATASADYTTKSPYTTDLAADTLSGYGLSALSVTANDFVLSSGSTLNLAAGGSLSVTAGGAIDIAGTVSAAGGAVNLVTDRTQISARFTDKLFKAPTDQSGRAIAANIFVEGTLDVSGRFVNDIGRAGTDAFGSAFINGGTIAITTRRSSDNVAGGHRDTTGSVLLSASSVLDVSSGGYISAQSKPKTASSGVIAGKAGSISLAIYQGLPWTEPSGGDPHRPDAAVSKLAVLQLDGSLIGYGFESDGSLRLAGVDTVRIGGTLQPGETSSIRIGGVASTLPASLLTGGGFGAYTIESTKDDWSGATSNIIVSAGTSLTLQQQNLSSLADYTATPSGTRLGQQATPQAALLPDDQRKPVNLALKADNILLDAGSKIATDPKASITFAAVTSDRSGASGSPKPDTPDWNVPAQSVELRGTIVDHGGTVFINALKTHLSSQAQIDLSGAFISNALFGTTNGPATSGTYIAGGTFAVEAGQINLVTNQTYYAYSAPTGVNYLVADAGALVDVSGAAGDIRVAGARGATSSQRSWTDAGTVSADVAAFAWGGSFAATGGRYVASDGSVQADARANGGTILLGGGAMLLRQDATDVTSALADYRLGITPRSLAVAADQLAPFDNVYLYAAGGQGGATRIFTDRPGNIYGYSAPGWGTLTISGPLSWNVPNRLHIAAGSINAPTSGSVDARISASYVSLAGSGTKPAAGTSTLTVNAQTIDLEGAPTPSGAKPGDAVAGLDFSGFSQVNLNASGDLRFGTLKVANGIRKSTETVPTELSTFTGNLLSTGDLLLSAQRIYPVSAVTFTIQTPGNVTFTAPAGSHTDIPLSAGGGITVFANKIDQAGNLFAPLGKITLGNIDSSAASIVTQSVVLEPGSLTSVTLAGTTVPYGATADGTNWYYNANLNPLLQAPSKGLVLAGTTVARADGSTIDLRGGGDLLAMEWIQGKGGSRDTLSTTPSNQTVYALVPTQSSPVAAFDIHFASARSFDLGKTITAGDAIPLAGQQIMIDGGGGIPAGTYTLYPARYATLPGAMRVVYYGDNTGRNLPTGTTLPDGTVLVTGHSTQSTVPGRQSSGESVFAVQTNSVWQQYSEYSFNGANAYFSQIAAKNNTSLRLPMDAGRLAASALQSIVLNGVALTQPGQDGSGNSGRGGELDISAPKLAVVGHAGYVNNDIRPGYVGLDIAQLKGFESILIGGLRSDTTTGTLITPTAASVLVDTRGEAFSAPEILLVAQVAKPTRLQTIPQTLTVNGRTVAVENQIFAPAPESGTVRIAAGSIIASTGVVHTGAGRNYYFADPTPDGTAASTTQEIATALGGTLDATGTVIAGADISKLSYFVQNADGSLVINPDGSQYRHTGSISAGDLSKLQNYSYQTKGLNALFVASNDTSLNVSIPNKLAPPSLTIQFAPSTDANVTGAMSGSLLLPDGGRVHIEPGVNITGNVLTLHATATTNSVVLNSSDLHLQQLNMSARTIGLGSPTLVTDKSLALYNQQFADVQALSLKALSGVATLYGDFNPGAARLTLDAAAIVRADGAGSASLSVNSGTIQLINTGASNVPANPPSAKGGIELLISGSDIVLGGGTQSILGYGLVRMHATDRVLAAGAGTMTLGAGNDSADLVVATPSFLVAGATAAGGGSFEITTRNQGNIAVISSLTQSGFPDRPADSAETGGSLKLTAKNIIVDSTIQAQAGTITLAASGGDFGVRLMPHAYLAAGGYTKTLVDVDTYLAGGKVVLSSDANIMADAHSVIDVAQPAGAPGYGGEITVTALKGNATLAGILQGSGGSGHGGRFKLDINGSADLTALADQLLAGGISGAIDIHTRTGNLALSQGHTLKANAVTLTADDPTWVTNNANQQLGQISIAGLIDARGYGGATLDGLGRAGGQVALYGANAVTLASSGVIDASTTHPDERGGDVTVGIGWGANSKIFLQTGTQINVSGGTKGGLSGGTVTLRAPLDGNNDVKIAGLSNVRNSNGSFDELSVIDGNNIRITGARSLAVNGFVSFDTHASSYGLDGSSLGWSGVIDPAGWYTGTDQNGKLIPATFGTWTNVSGWRISTIDTGSGFSSVPTGPVAITGGGGSGAKLTNFVMGIYAFVADNPGFPPDQNDIPVTFSPPQTAGGVLARAIASTDANGILSIRIVDPGSGYTSPPQSAIVGGMTVTPRSLFGRPQSTLRVVSAQIVLPSGGGGYDDAASSPVATVFSQGGLAFVRFKNASGFSGATTPDSNGQPQFVADTTDYIPFLSSGVYAFDPARQGTPGIANFAGGAGTSRPFLVDTLSQVAQGTWTYNGKSYGFSNLFKRLQLGTDVVHVQPGIELVNSTGNIIVASNWNLAAATAGNLQTATNPTNNQSFPYFDPASSYVKFNYRLATPWGGLDAGALTLRAAGNININASISDGFFQLGDYLDANYVQWVGQYLGALGDNTRGIDRANFATALSFYLNGYATGATPIAPYKAAGNIVNATSQDLAAADLFPHTLRVCTVDCSAANIKPVTAPSSWSYGFTAGADVSSANPNARISLAAALDGGKGDVIVDKHSIYNQPYQTDGSATAQVNLPTMVRTGTGSITISAARDVVFSDGAAPGVIYAAGVNAAKLNDPGYRQQTANGASSIVADDPSGFLEPRLLAYGTGAAAMYGPPTAAAFPEAGGDVRIDAQRDIVGNAITDPKIPQYYQPWLISDAGYPNASQLAAGSLNAFGAGVFAPLGPAIASQTAWWIQYGSFQQGILSAGGNVTVLAGRDLKDVSVSLPTTGRVSGGLSAESTPLTHLYGSGNMLVRAGRDILGGAFHEGSGHSSIVAGASIGQNGFVSRVSGKLTFADVPLLAVDTGQIEMMAGGPITIAGVVNPAALHAQSGSFVNTYDTGISGVPAVPLYINTYGPDSRVRLVAQTGDLTINIAPTAFNESGYLGPQAVAAMYPASFEALALGGSLITTGINQLQRSTASIPMPGIVLSPSEHGTLDLLAQNSIDLSFGYPKNPSSLLSATPRPYLSAGASLIETAFDPFQPNSGFGGAFNGAVLAHQNDAFAGIDATVRIYAATGDITATGNYGKRTDSDPPDLKVYQRAEINRPTKVYAGRDIVDLNIIVQNIHASDVSKIEAGRNIYYTGYHNGGGLQVAGAGSFVVQAGGDIGPFLPLAHDNPSEAAIQQGIASVGNASPTAVGNFYVANTTGGGSVGVYDTALLGPNDNPRRNSQLTDAAGTTGGAGVVTMFGTKFGADYRAVANAYVDPANAAGVDHNYIAELQAFLARVGKPASGTDAASMLSAFKGLPADLQQVFVDQVFFAELKAVGVDRESGKAESQRGYKMINTMFPSSLGYTANALGSGTNGAGALVQTGDLNLLHATMQTRLGGDISIFGPGGNLVVGSLATEPNTSLKLPDLGILTLGGGAINTFTDQNARVNSSRVLTSQGGDILMWSSNGDLDAGRGSKTVASAPALQVFYDQNDYQRIDLGGFVTGSGIRTLRASTVAQAANVYLIAPRGTIDAGTAGIGSSGTVVVIAPVVSNAGNIQAQGGTVGVPVISVPNIGALTAGSNTAGAAAKSADAPTASGNRSQASIFIVEVIGYGGGDGQGESSADKKQSDAQSSDEAKP